MLTRRRFLQSALVAGSLPLLTPLARAVTTSVAPGDDLTRHVDVFIGTGGHGHTFPGATVPFGMVQLSPDTFNAYWDESSGFHQDDNSIMGFSHTHLTGTGCGDLLDVLVMPNVGEVRIVPGTPPKPIGQYHSRFDAKRQPGPDDEKAVVLAPQAGYRSSYVHADESAEPGYYKVLLRDRNVTAELTATARVGVHRYTFPASKASHIVVDLHHGMQDYPNTQPAIIGSELRVVGNDTLLGGRRMDGWAKGRHIYFAMKFSRPFERSELFVDDKAVSGALHEASGKNVKCVVHMPTRDGEQILVKVGLSAVSPEGAMRNLEAEVPGWDFDGVRAAARHEWQSELGRMQITSMDNRHQRMFYSALYHSLLAPTLFNDVDGQYRGADLEVRKLPAGTNTYTEYSLWDTYRALHPLFTLVQPERVPDLVNGMILIAEQSPDGVPVWPLQARETGTMPGYHSASVLAEAQAKGFKGIDYAHAYPLWRKRAMYDDYRGLPLYREKGFIPADKESESVSKTLEYAYDDWAMASLATAVGQHDDATLLKKRSQNYQHVFDAKLQFVRPKLDDGSWTEPFDPRDMGHSSRWRDFTESNAWQATFLNQHDIHTYIGMFGGDKAFVTKLDALFTADSTLPANAPPDIAGMVGQYAHGNEPSHHVAYMYAYAGQPWKTQSRVRNLLETMYDDKPDGEAGNDDCGQVSAWLILSSLGLYPVDPVSGHYVFGSPAVVHAELALAEGRRLVIDAVGNSAANVYVQSVKFNGRAYDRNWITHADLVRGGHLEFTMGATPNKSFGAEASARPPSYGKPA